MPEIQVTPLDSKVVKDLGIRLIGFQALMENIDTTSPIGKKLS